MRNWIRVSLKVMVALPLLLSQLSVAGHASAANYFQVAVDRSSTSVKSTVVTGTVLHCAWDATTQTNKDMFFTQRYTYKYIGSGKITILSASSYATSVAAGHIVYDYWTISDPGNGKNFRMPQVIEDFPAVSRALNYTVSLSGMPQFVASPGGGAGTTCGGIYLVVQFV